MDGAHLSILQAGQPGQEIAGIRVGDAIPIQLNDVHSFENNSSETLEMMVVGVSRDNEKRVDVVEGNALARSATRKLFEQRGVKLQFFKQLKEVFEDLFNHVWGAIRLAWDDEMKAIKKSLDTQLQPIAHQAFPFLDPTGLLHPPGRRIQQVRGLANQWIWKSLNRHLPRGATCHPARKLIADRKEAK